MSGFIRQIKTSEKTFENVRLKNSLIKVQGKTEVSNIEKFRYHLPKKAKRHGHIIFGHRDSSALYRTEVVASSYKRSRG